MYGNVLSFVCLKVMCVYKCYGLCMHACMYVCMYVYMYVSRCMLSCVACVPRPAVCVDERVSMGCAHIHDMCVEEGVAE